MKWWCFTHGSTAVADGWEKQKLTFDLTVGESTAAAYALKT